MTEYRVSCESTYEIVRERDDEDEWDAGEDAYTNHSFSVYKKGDLGFRQADDFSFESDLSNPKIVVVIYGDGCTFGYTSGLVEYFGPFSEAEASKLKVLIEQEKIEEFTTIVGKGKYVSVPWTGYFAHLQEVRIV